MTSTENPALTLDSALAADSPDSSRDSAGDGKKGKQEK